MAPKTTAREAYQSPLLIRSFLAHGVNKSPSKEIVSADECRYTYRDFERRVNKLANALSALGVKEGHTVAVMDWDSHRYLECFFAIPMMGAILHSINVRLSPQQVLYTINHASDDVILVHDDFLPLLASVRAGIEKPPVLVRLKSPSGGADLPSGFAGEYGALLADAADAHAFPHLREDAVATLFYTTGTTGDPKCVYFTHRHIVLHSMSGAVSLGTPDHVFRLHERDVYMPLTPMFHVHAWGFPYTATLLGLKQVYPGRYEPLKLLRLLEDEAVTLSHCVPTILRMVLGHPSAVGRDFSRLKVIVGGASMTDAVVRLAQRFGIQVLTGYGMSETCPLLTFSDISRHDPDDRSPAANRARTITGRPAALAEVRVVDADMRDVARDGRAQGEVVARAPWLTQGYVGDQERSDALWRGGYLHTGDVAVMHPDGSLMIVDRLKDVIKSGGEWVSSLQLEDICSSCECVAEAAAFGVPDERWDERPMIVAVPAKGAEPAECEAQIGAAVKAAVESGALSKWASPERVVLVESIPKTSVGKLDKKVLRQQYIESNGV